MTNDNEQTREGVMHALDPEIAERVEEEGNGLGTMGYVAMASVPLALAATARSAFGQSLPQNVVDILNFALTLEYLENEFYIAGLAADGLIPASDRSIFQTIQTHEQDHVDFLKSTLGAQAVAKPSFDFTAGGAFNTFGSYPTFRLLAQAFEDTGVRAYKGQAPNLIGNDAVLTAALTIHSVEARHAARVRRLNGLQGWIPLAQPGVPAAAQPVYAGEAQTQQLGVDVPSVASLGQEVVSEAFDEPLTKDQVLAIAGQFIEG